MGFVNIMVKIACDTSWKKLKKKNRSYSVKCIVWTNLMYGEQWRDVFDG